MHNLLKQPILRKVPEITLAFWIIKLLSTALGESASDYLVSVGNPYLVVAIGFVAFVIALTLQFRARGYSPWIYWLAIVMVAIFGTMNADVLHTGLGVSYGASSAVFAVALALLLAAWWHCERSLSIHDITTRQRELFYWATVCAAFALGTAAGDFFANGLHLGYLDSAVVFTILFALPTMYWLAFRRASVACFWIAYVLTRPIGASFADWFGKPMTAGGLGFGDGGTACVLALATIALVIFAQRRESQRSHSGAWSKTHRRTPRPDHVDDHLQ